VTDETITLSMARVEGAQLAQLVDDLRDLVGADRDLSDPAIARLAPSPYPDDDGAAQAFAEATRADLLDRRALDADVVRTALSPLRGRLEDLTENEAFREHEVAIPARDVDSWLRTLTALRLIVAERLEITTDDDHDDEDPRFGVYDWLGYRLELLIQAADPLL